MIRATILILSLIVAGLLASPRSYAHGGVVEEDDLCIIKVNYLRGHFKIYQPLTDGHEEYCEDLPKATESVFVMEYLHDSLGNASVDFRIIRDVTGKGRFARWEDVAAIGDLEEATVFYREPAVDPDVLTVIHDFKEEGEYIGIVTASVQGDDAIYRAVFPFEVGFTGLGYWPLFIALVLIVQLQYFVMSGRLQRWRRARRVRKPELRVAPMLFLVVMPLLLTTKAVADVAAPWASERGLYRLSFESSIDPIRINQMHGWVLRIERDGEPVTGAKITVDGGMPAHDHGLPTRPRVTAELGGGAYRLEGVRFHMRGEWELTIAIEADGETDTVVITLTL